MGANAADGTVEIGVTDHAQHALGDLVFVEVPEGGRTVAVGEPAAVVESVKAASDVYSPIAGEVTLGNPGLAAEPEAVNNDPYGKGWLMRLRPTKGAPTRCSHVGSGLPEAVAGGGRLMAFIPHTPADVEAMLATIGVPSIEQLFDEIPASLRVKSLDGVPVGLNEMQIGRLMSERARADGRPLCFNRSWSVRASHSVCRVGHYDSRRVLQRLHAIPGGGEPGHAAAHLRISVDDGQPHRDGRFECLVV